MRILINSSHCSLLVYNFESLFSNISELQANFCVYTNVLTSDMASSSMTINQAGDAHLTLAIPASIPTTADVQISVARSSNTDDQIFLERKLQVKDLALSNLGNGTKTLTIPTTEMPSFASGEDVRMRAHLTRRDKCLETFDLGIYSY